MEKSNYDVIVLGAGPAGMQAAIHAARRKASVLVIGKFAKSSAYTAYIENFCCLDAQSGKDMLNLAREKAEAPGAAIREEDVIALGIDNDLYFAEMENGQSIKAHALVLAMGVSRNSLGLDNEKALIGRGVSYCVDCDGPLFREVPVAVAGCGSAAVSGALTMMFYASDVHLICEQLDVGDHLARALKESDIVVHEGRKVKKIQGKDELEAVVLDDMTELSVKGLFIQRGAKGAVGFAGGLGVLLDETMEYIEVNRKQETNLPGVYAAGDICGPPWQVAKAVGEGCIAGLEAAAYASKQRDTERG